MEGVGLKKNVIIFGYNGMLGSRISKTFIVDSDHNVFLAGRKKPIQKDFDNAQFIYFDAFTSDLEQIIKTINPDYVINSLGWIKQKKEDQSLGLLVNSVVPHRLSELSYYFDFKLIHFRCHAKLSRQVEQFQMRRCQGNLTH